MFNFDFTIVSAVTPDYLDMFYWSAPSWTVKPQFADKPLIVYHHGFKRPEKELAFLEKLSFPSVTLIQWDMPEAADDRERMISAFVLGSARDVHTERFVKVDADCYFTNADDVFQAEDLAHDIVAPSWNYTKPGYWISVLDAWGKGEPPPSKPEGMPERHRAPRFISYCCLHKTDFVRKAAQLAGQRLPVPSHDGYLWWLAENCREFSWANRKVKDHGVHHSGHKARHIRIAVCASPAAWNSVHHETLLAHIQLEITTACNLTCPNCDRACGIAPSAERMSLAQVQKFAAECQAAGKRFDRIDILGGEPTLHPDLLAILDAVRPYARRVRLTSNGTGERVQAVLKTVPEWVQVRNSSGEKGAPKFEAVNLAPCDSGVPSPSACSIPWRCGIALTSHGYFPCGAGAAVARVFGIDCGIRTLDGLLGNDLRQRLPQLCRLCGHSRSTVKETTVQETSPSWEAAVKTYKAHKLAEY